MLICLHEPGAPLLNAAAGTAQLYEKKNVLGIKTI